MEAIGKRNENMNNNPETIMLQLKTCPICNGEDRSMICARCNGQGQLVIIPSDYQTISEDVWDIIEHMFDDTGEE